MIEEYVSKAIEDGDISNKEFVLITSEPKKFNELKEKIQAKMSTKLEAAKMINKADFEGQVKERAKVTASELKKRSYKKLGRVSLSFIKSFKTDGEKLPPTWYLSIA